MKISKTYEQNMELYAELRLTQRRLQLAEKKIKYLESKYPHKINYSYLHLDKRKGKIKTPEAKK